MLCLVASFDRTCSLTGPELTLSHSPESPCCLSGDKQTKKHCDNVQCYARLLLSVCAFPLFQHDQHTGRPRGHIQEWAQALGLTFLLATAAITQAASCNDAGIHALLPIIYVYSDQGTLIHCMVPHAVTVAKP